MAKRFEELEVWQEARELVKHVYKLTAEFPQRENFGLTNQMQRAAVSVMSNIAEGFERGANTEFVHFLYIARASCAEVRSQSYVAIDLNYISSAVHDEIRERCERLSRRINTLIEYLKNNDLRGIKFREGRTEYEIQEP